MAHPCHCGTEATTMNSYRDVPQFRVWPAEDLDFVRTWFLQHEMCTGHKRMWKQWMNMPLTWIRKANKHHLPLTIFCRYIQTSSIHGIQEGHLIMWLVAINFPPLQRKSFLHGTKTKKQWFHSGCDILDSASLSSSPHLTQICYRGHQCYVPESLCYIGFWT